MIKKLLIAFAAASMVAACSSEPPPPPQPQPQQVQASSFMVFFDWDRSNLSAQAVNTIGQAAAAFKQTGAARIVATGHVADRHGPFLRRWLSPIDGGANLTHAHAQHRIGDGIENSNQPLRARGIGEHRRQQRSDRLRGGRNRDDQGRKGDDGLTHGEHQ